MPRCHRSRQLGCRGHHAVTPGEHHRGIRRSLNAKRALPWRAAGFLSCEGTPDSPVEGGHVMTADALEKLTTESLNQLAAMLDQGHSDRLTSLLATMARFHRYSLHNVFLIVAQRPTATRVAGFHTWRTLGRWVRKGEKGIAILAPITARRRDDANDDDRVQL